MPSTGESAGPLPRPIAILSGLAALVVSIAGLRAFSGTLGPAFLALILVIAVHPLQARLRRHGAPGWAGIVVMLVVVYALLLGLVAALVVSVARLATLLPDYGPQVTDLLNRATGWLEDLGVEREQISTAIDRLDLSNVVGKLQQVLAKLSSVLSGLLLVVTLVLFMAMDGAGLERRLDVVAESRPHLMGALREFAHRTRRYMAVSTVFGLIVAVLDVGILYWLAIPLPLLWGLLSFITNYIPNIGFVLGLVPPALLGLLEGGVVRMAWVVVAYSAINMVIQSFVQPKVVGDTVGLSATLTFLSLVFWAFVLGPLGALLAIPLSLLAKALLVDSDPAAQWLRPLLGDTTARIISGNASNINT